MNVEDIRQRFLQRQLRTERKFAARIQRAFNKQVLSFVERYQRGSVEVILDSTPMRKAVEELYKTVVLTEANSTWDALKKMAPREKRASIGQNKVWERDVTEFLDEYLIRMVRGIDDATRNYIVNILKRAFTEGLSNDEVVREIMDLQGINKVRAYRIVRTETTRAANFGKMLGAFDSEYEYEKKWINIPDKRVRVTHSHVTGVGGEWRDFLQPFGNGLMFPGDPNAWPDDPDRRKKETINCRCTVAFKLKKDGAGRAIRKQRPNEFLGGTVALQRRPLLQMLTEGQVRYIVNNAINEYLGG